VRAGVLLSDARRVVYCSLRTDLLFRTGKFYSVGLASSPRVLVEGCEERERGGVKLPCFAIRVS
jgi:hypothetical protein